MIFLPILSKAPETGSQNLFMRTIIEDLDAPRLLFGRDSECFHLAVEITALKPQQFRKMKTLGIAPKE